MSRIEYTSEQETADDAYLEDALFSNQCLATDAAGEHCAHTLHLTGPHTWEQT